MNANTDNIRQQLAVLFEGNGADQRTLYDLVQGLDSVISIGLTGRYEDFQSRLFLRSDPNSLPVIEMELTIAQAKIRKAWRLCGKEADGAFAVETYSAVNDAIRLKHVSEIDYENSHYLNPSQIFEAVLRELKSFVPEDKRANFDHVIGKFLEQQISMKNISQHAPELPAATPA